MKKNLFLPALGLAMLLTTISCSKSETDPGSANNVSLTGKWVGTYNNGASGPVSYFSLTFKAGGELTVNANNASTPDVGSGTWTLVGDNIDATFTYITSSAVYSMAAKFSASSTAMTGTIGLSPSTSGESVFSVTKE